MPWVGLAVSRDRGFEFARAGPEDEGLRIADRFDGGVDLGFERPVLGLQIEQRHLHRRRGLGRHGGLRAAKPP
jgi:hypothetical protein